MTYFHVIGYNNFTFTSNTHLVKVQKYRYKT